MHGKLQGPPNVSYTASLLILILEYLDIASSKDVVPSHNSGDVNQTNPLPGLRFLSKDPVP